MEGVCLIYERGGRRGRKGEQGGGKDRELSRYWRWRRWEGWKTYVDDVQRLVHAGLRVERKARVDLGRDLAGDDLENLAAELDEQAVERGVDFLIEVFALSIAKVLTPLPCFQTLQSPRFPLR